MLIYSLNNEMDLAKALQILSHHQYFTIYNIKSVFEVT